MSRDTYLRKVEVDFVTIEISVEGVAVCVVHSDSPLALQRNVSTIGVVPSLIIVLPRKLCEKSGQRYEAEATTRRGDDERSGQRNGQLTALKSRV